MVAWRSRLPMAAALHKVIEGMHTAIFLPAMQPTIGRSNAAIPDLLDLACLPTAD